MNLQTASPSRRQPPSIAVTRLRDLAIRGLTRMYRPDEGLFAFRLRRTGDGVILEGTSVRYTAIALIGLAGEDATVQRTVLAGLSAREACEHLVGTARAPENLGDVALLLWAVCAARYPERRSVADRLRAFRPDAAPHATVEVAWALAALCADVEASARPLRDRLARRLIASWDPSSGMFPHRLGEEHRGLRGHVCCFADLVYPIHALARYAELSGDAEACDVAVRCANTVCARQGTAGQWWWHYDRRTGEVVEPYPVYAVHQDSMAPMAFFALQSAAGVDLRPPIARGLDWLTQPVELEARSLVDEREGVIWRKVARREPGKLARFVQAAATGLHPDLRVPGLDALFPAGAIDHEDRPYHLGWLLHAWPAERAVAWTAGGVTR